MRLRFRWPLYIKEERQHGTVSLREIRTHLEDDLLQRELSPAEVSVIFGTAFNKFAPEERVL